MKARSWLVYLLTLGTDLLGALAALLLLPLGARGYRFERRPKGPGLWALTCDSPWLPGRYGAMTIAPHVIVYRKGRRLPRGWSRLQDHEHSHSEQYEAAGLIGSLVGLCAFLGAVAPWLGVVAWVGVPWADMGAGFVVAWLRGEDPYRGSHNEEAAYALASEDDE